MSKIYCSLQGGDLELNTNHTGAPILWVHDCSVYLSLAELAVLKQCLEELLHTYEVGDDL